MTVFRRPASRNYFSSKRNWMQDPRLSIAATGLHAKMMSMPEDWEFTQKELSKRLKDGKFSIRSAMMELVKYGYLIKHPTIRKKGGQYDKPFYDAWDESQIDNELSNEDVKKIFSNSYRYEDFTEIYEKSNKSSESDFQTRTVSDFRISGKRTLQEKESPSETEKNNNSHEELPSEVVVFSCLRTLNITDPYRRLLSREMNEDKANVLVKRVLAWKDRKSDIIACRTILNRWDEWGDEPSKQEIQEQKEIQEGIDQKREDENRRRAVAIKAQIPSIPAKVRSYGVEVKSGRGFFHILFRDPSFDDHMDALIGIHKLNESKEI